MKIGSDDIAAEFARLCILVQLDNGETTPGFGFTGATVRRIGRFEQANGSTILLDGVGDMTMSTPA